MNAIRPLNYRTKWSYDDKLLLEKLFAEGKTDEQMACILGRTRVSVINMRDEMGLQHGQQCSNRRLFAGSMGLPKDAFKDFDREDAERVKRWFAPDYEFPNVNLLKITEVPKPEAASHVTPTNKREG